MASSGTERLRAFGRRGPVTSSTPLYISAQVPHSAQVKPGASTNVRPAGAVNAPRVDHMTCLPPDSTAKHCTSTSWPSSGVIRTQLVTNSSLPGHRGFNALRFAATRLGRGHRRLHRPANRAARARTWTGSAPAAPQFRPLAASAAAPTQRQRHTRLACHFHALYAKMMH